MFFLVSAALTTIWLLVRANAMLSNDDPYRTLGILHGANSTVVKRALRNKHREFWIYSNCGRYFD